MNQEFIQNLTEASIVELDVRKNLSQGNDPFHVIMEAIEKLPADRILKLIAPFEPKPLISILRQKGYDSFVSHESAPMVLTYFRKNENADSISTTVDETPSAKNEIDLILKKFEGKIKETDVRELEMPLPMVTILKELDKLPSDELLYVHHKKVPQFLLPELVERKYKWLIQEIADGNTKLLIYK